VVEREREGERERELPEQNGSWYLSGEVEGARESLSISDGERRQDLQAVCEAGGEEGEGGFGKSGIRQLI
jgi:hypothetical protein